MNKISFFIIGLPRSGTKLLRSVLNKHPDIFIPDIEVLFIPRMLEKYQDKLLVEQDFQDIISDIRKSLFYFYYSDNLNFDFQVIKNNSKTIKDFLGNFLSYIAGEKDENTLFIGEKSPNNIFNMKILSAYFPDVKFIHIVRDPRDVVLSAKKAWNKNMYRSASEWERGIKSLKSVIKNINCLEVKYEDLLKSPIHQIKKITDFLGVKFEKEMLEIGKTENYGDAKDTSGILKSNSGKFNLQLRKKQIKKIESYAHSMYRYGYSPVNDNTPLLFPTQIQIFIWKYIDRFNLVGFNFREHGFKKGIQKSFRAFKERLN